MNLSGALSLAVSALILTWEPSIAPTIFGRLVRSANDAIGEFISSSLWKFCVRQEVRKGYQQSLNISNDRKSRNKRASFTQSYLSHNQQSYSIALVCTSYVFACMFYLNLSKKKKMLPHVKSSERFLKVSQFSEKYKLTLMNWKVKFLVFEAAGTIVRKWFDPNQLQSIIFWSTDYGGLYVAPDLTVVKLWSLVFTCSHVEDVAGKDHISWYTWETSRSSWLWRLANGSCSLSLPSS